MSEIKSDAPRIKVTVEIEGEEVRKLELESLFLVGLRSIEEGGANMTTATIGNYGYFSQCAIKRAAEEALAEHCGIASATESLDKALRAMGGK